MSNEQPGGFVYRTPEDIPDIDTLRTQADDLKPPAFDVSELAAFALAEKVEIGAITEHLRPGTGTGLQVGADLGDLSEELRQLREREADTRLRRFLDQAQRKMAEERYQSAIVLIDQALAIDPANAPALLLKAYCYFELDDLDPALALLAMAHQHATDAATVMIVLALRAACEREVMRSFEDELVDLLNDGQEELALQLVEQRLRQYPEDPALLHTRCVLLLSAGRLATARDAAQRALSGVSEPNRRHFQELLRQIAIRDSQKLLEAVRGHLRRGDTHRALAQLDSCPAELHGDEHFDSLFRYARQRHADGATGLIRWTRKRRLSVEPLQNAALQQLLCWLLQEELQEGVKGLNHKQFDKAKRSLAAAERIDGRCDIVAFLYAMAILKALRGAFDRERLPSLDQADAELRQARQLATRPLRNPVVGEHSRALLTAIDNDQRAINKIRARVEKARPVAESIKRYNMLIEHFERNPVRSRAELMAARRMFETLGREVSRLRGNYAPGSEEKQALDKLAQAIQNIEAQLAF